MGAAAHRTRRRGRLRPPPGRPIPARDDVQALAPGQAAGSVPLRPARGDRALVLARIFGRLIDSRRRRSSAAAGSPGSTSRRWTDSGGPRSSASSRVADGAAATATAGAAEPTATRSDARHGRPDVVVRRVPPHRRGERGARLVERGIPFLTEKPLAAAMPRAPVRARRCRSRLRARSSPSATTRGLEHPERSGTARRGRPHLVVGRWLAGTPPPSWWRRTAEGGGQAVEQATHLYDLARVLVGEATVVGAPRRACRPSPPVIDVADATTALLGFDAAPRLARRYRPAGRDRV